MFLNKTAPLLEKISRQITDIAKQIGNNFDTLTGIVAELTETCTVASGQAAMNQRELSVTEQVNIKESEMTEAQIKEMIQKRKQLIESIQKAEEEFARVVLELPGALNLLTTTAVDRCTTAIHKVSRFFRKVTEKLTKLDVFGLFHTSYKELKDIGENIGNYFTADVVDDSEEPTNYGDNTTEQSEEVAKDMMIYLEVLKIKPAVDTMIQMLLDQGDLNIQRTNNTVWETQAKLDANMRVLKNKKNKKEVKKSEMHVELETIVTSLHNICEIVLGESKAMNPSKETYQHVLSDLTDAQEKLKSMSEVLKKKLDAVASAENTSPLPESPEQHKGFMVLERVATQRFAKGKKLHMELRRYDRETENITSHFEMQKETAALLSQLEVELNELRKTLEFLSTASIDLTNVSSLKQCPKLVIHSGVKNDTVMCLIFN